MSFTESLVIRYACSHHGGLFIVSQDTLLRVWAIFSLPPPRTEEASFLKCRKFKANSNVPNIRKIPLVKSNAKAKTDIMPTKHSAKCPGGHIHCRSSSIKHDKHNHSKARRAEKSGGGHSHENLNTRGMFLYVLRDAVNAALN